MSQSTNGRNRLNYSSSLKARRIMKNEKDDFLTPFSRDNELRHSTGSMKGSKRMEVNVSHTVINGVNGNSADSVDNVPTSVHNLIKGFQTKIVSSSVKNNKSDTDSANYNTFQTPGYVVDSPIVDPTKNLNSKRKLSLRNKKNKLTASEARYNILQSLGVSPFVGNENRSFVKSFAYFDIQSLFFDVENAIPLKLQFEGAKSVSVILSGASAASQGVKSASGESSVDEGDNKENHLVLNCPYFRNEISVPEETDNTKTTYTKHGKDISKLISMFNRNRSYENFSKFDSHDVDKKYARRRQLESSEQDIFLEPIEDNSCFFTWDQPNVSGKQIFDFEHIDRGAMFYREYFCGKEHSNLFGIDEKYGPIAISIIREVLPKMALLTRTNETKNQTKRQYRLILRTCEESTLRISVLENSIPSTSRHNSSTRPIPIKDVLEFCFPDLQSSCLRYALQTPKVIDQLLKLDERKLSLKHKVGVLYCKAGQNTEFQMYNNEKGGSEFLEFCSVIADKVALKGFQGYLGQLDNKNDTTGHHSLYTTFHGREIMFHVSTELPFGINDEQQLLRKRHIGNDIVTIVFQEPGSEPFSPQMVRSHFQHVFIVVRVENPHTDHTKYEIAVSRSKDVPYFGPPIPPDKFTKNSTFREFLLTKVINAESSAIKSAKFSHMASRTRHGYLVDLAKNNVSTQTVETSTKFGFSFSTKKKEKTKPAVNPEIWLQGGLIWEVKFEFGDDSPGSESYLSISTKAITLVEKCSQELLATISCKSVLGWKTTSHTLKLFYDTGKMVYFSLIDKDLHELAYVVNRLKTVTTGCETQDLTLRRNKDGQLGFHVFYEGLVAEVEPYGFAWHSGLRKGSRLLEISNHVVCKMSHERMISMLRKPDAVRIVVLPPAPDGQPRNYKAVRNLRRYSSMTSVYSMSVNNMTGIGEESSSGLSSSRENLQCSSETEKAVVDTTNKIRSLSMEGQTPGQINSSSNTSFDGSSDSSPPLPPHRGIKHMNSSHERIIASRSATDITADISPIIPARNNTYVHAKQTISSPQASLDQEWGDLERNLTDARKSIDAKFYRSLANSQSPFFKPSRPPGLMSPDEKVVEEEYCQTTARVYTRSSSEKHYPIVNVIMNTKEQFVKKSSVVSSFTNEFETPGYAIVDAPRQFGVNQETTTSLSDCSNNSIARESQESLVSEKDSDSAKRGSLVKMKIRDAKEIINERISNSPVATRKERHSKSFSFEQPPQSPVKTIKTGVSVAARKQIFTGDTVEVLLSPKRSAKVDSPIYFRKRSDPSIKPLHIITQPQAVPQVQTPLKKKTVPSHLQRDSIGRSPDNMRKYDESLSETFAKIDAAFGFKPPTPTSATREEKRKKRKTFRRRSRNCEPPTSDSSEESELIANKRNGRLFKKFLYDENFIIKVPKSEAEESLEAAITDFQMSLKTIPTENQSKRSTSIQSEPALGSATRHSRTAAHGEEDPPKVPTRTSRPQILTDMKRLRQMKSEPDGLNESGVSNNAEHKRPRSEGTFNNNIYEIDNSRPESPLYRPKMGVATSKHEHVSQPMKVKQADAFVKETAITGDTEIIVEDQLSPLPYLPSTLSRGGVQSLPHRKHKRSSTTNTYDNIIRSCSTSCIPLVVRGLDLAACKEAVDTGSWSKEDMHVMLTVMENELEQEREEKERLIMELDRSREEKDRLLEQSKQAATQLRKFTTLFLDSTPQNVKYSASSPR